MNFPMMICVLLMGEENNNLIEPFAFSLLISPIVSNGIYR